MPHHAAADFAGLIHRITETADPSPFDIIELRRAIAAGFVSQHPIAALQAAHDRGMSDAEFHARFALARALAAQPLAPAGDGALPGSRQRFKGVRPRKGEGAHQRNSFGSFACDCDRRG